MLMVQHPLPYFDIRRNDKKPEYIILHYTDTPNLESTIDILKQNELSSHYCIDEDGTIIKFVDEDMRAWHAGLSYWHGRDDINSSSIGIEIQNSGHSHGHKIFPKSQIDAVIKLSKDIMRRHNIPTQNVIAHSDIAPGRKQDPGYLFPWKDLAIQGVGIWPNVTKEHIEKARKIAEKENKIKRLFKDIGYAPVNNFDIDAPKLKDIITAFQLHFEPEIFSSFHSEDKIGIASIKTIALAVAVSEIIQ